MSRMFIALLTGLLVPVSAYAVPMQLAHQGRLLDADGSPLEGEHTLTFTLFDAATDGTSVWAEDIEADLVGGFYSAILGADEDDNPLDDLVLGGGRVWLELAVDGGEPLAPRHELVSVPYAVMAGTATNVDGGYVDATEVAIDGTTVIDSTGAWVGPSPSIDYGDLTGVPDATAPAWDELTGVPDGLLDGEDADSLGGLSCADEGVAKFDISAGLWGCGTDAVLGSSDVLAYVDGATLALGAGSSVDGSSIATVDSLTWGLLADIPGDFADGLDSDTLMDLALACAEGDRPSWDLLAGVWTCASEQVALDRLATAGAAEGQVLTYDGASVAWEDSVAAESPCTLSYLDQSLGGALVDCGTTSMVLRTWLHAAQIGAGVDHTCVTTGNGSAVCWGRDSYGQSSPPGGTFIEVDGGQNHSCGLDTAGAAVCWGWDNYGQSSPSGGVFTQSSTGDHHTCAIDTTGTIQCWGQDFEGQATPPSGTFVQVSSGANHSCAIDGVGAIQCWGRDYEGQSTPPAGTFVQVSAGGSHSCAVDGVGSIQCWGYDNYGQSTPPSGTFTQVSVATSHSCAVDDTGGLECWGWNTYGQAAPPEGSFTQVSVGTSHSCAIVAGLSAVVCWGYNGQDQTNVP